MAAEQAQRPQPPILARRASCQRRGTVVQEGICGDSLIARGDSIMGPGRGSRVDSLEDELGRKLRINIEDPFIGLWGKILWMGSGG